jgi:hypothetical protein
VGSQVTIRKQDLHTKCRSFVSLFHQARLELHNEHATYDVLVPFMCVSGELLKSAITMFCPWNGLNLGKVLQSSGFVSVMWEASDCMHLHRLEFL